MAKYGFTATMTKTIHLVVENGKDDSDALKKAKRLAEFFLDYDSTEIEEKKEDILESKNGCGVFSAGAKGAVTSLDAEILVDVDEDFDTDTHEEEEEGHESADISGLEEEEEDVE